MASELDQDLAEVLELSLRCSLCLERCRRPRSLYCLHTFCQDCLVQLVDNCAQSSIVICPECRLAFYVPPGGALYYPEAFAWRVLAETLDRFRIRPSKNTDKCKVPVEDKALKSPPCLPPLDYKIVNAFKHIMLSAFTAAPDAIMSTNGSQGNAAAYVTSTNDTPTVITSQNSMSLRGTSADTSAGTRDASLVSVSNESSTGLSQRDNISLSSPTSFSLQIGNTQLSQTSDDSSTETVTAPSVIPENSESSVTLEADTIVVTQTSDASSLLSATSSTETTTSSSAATENDPTADSATSYGEPDILPQTSDDSSAETMTYATEVQDNVTSDSLTLSTSSSTESATIFGTNYKAQNNFAQVSVTTYEERVSLRVKKVREMTLLYQPSNMSCLPNGDIIICQNWGNGVFVYSPDGTKVMRLKISNGYAATDVDHTADGSMLVAEKTSKSILMFSQDGAFVKSMPLEFDSDTGIFVYGNEVFYTSNGNDKVYRMDIHSNRKNIFVEKADDSDLQKPAFITASATCVAFTTWGKPEARMYDRSGNLKFKYTGEGSGLKPLKLPCGVVIDSEGRLIISDCANDCIYFVSGEGEFLGHIDLKKDGMYGPTGIALNSDGELLVGMLYPHAIITFEYKNALKQ